MVSLFTVQELRTSWRGLKDLSSNIFRPNWWSRRACYPSVRCSPVFFCLKYVTHLNQLIVLAKERTFSTLFEMKKNQISVRKRQKYIKICLIVVWIAAMTMIFRTTKGYFTNSHLRSISLRKVFVLFYTWMNVWEHWHWSCFLISAFLKSYFCIFNWKNQF